jgi:hypothetical protein
MGQNEEIGERTDYIPFSVLPIRRSLRSARDLLFRSAITLRSFNLPR